MYLERSDDISVLCRVEADGFKSWLESGHQGAWDHQRHERVRPGVLTWKSQARCNPRSQETEAVGWRVRGQPRLHNAPWATSRVPISKPGEEKEEEKRNESPVLLWPQDLAVRLEIIKNPFMRKILERANITQSWRSSSLWMELVKKAF
jgi:hypothetical protein